MDLLTVVTHELGHQLGLADDDSDDLMAEFLSLGVRACPMDRDCIPERSRRPGRRPP